MTEKSFPAWSRQEVRVETKEFISLIEIDDHTDMGPSLPEQNFEQALPVPTPP